MGPEGPAGKGSGKGKRNKKELGNSKVCDVEAQTNEAKVAAWKKIVLRELCEASGCILLLSDTKHCKSLCEEITELQSQLKKTYNSVTAKQRDEDWDEATMNKCESLLF